MSDPKNPAPPGTPEPSQTPAATDPTPAIPKDTSPIETPNPNGNPATDGPADDAAATNAPTGEPDPAKPADSRDAADAADTAADSSSRPAGSDSAADAAIAADGKAADAGADSSDNAAVSAAADGEKAADGNKAADTDSDAGDDGRAGDAAGNDGDGKDGAKTGDRWRSVLMTLLSIVAVLAVVVGFGYFGGLGPLGRLSGKRALHPPDALGGLSRITDPEARSALELDTFAKDLDKSNSGRTAVEAYGDPTAETGLFVVIAMRGKIDTDRVVADTGATPDKVKKLRNVTCTTNPDETLACYRTSNTLTIMVRNSGKATVDRIAEVTDEAFRAFK